MTISKTKRDRFKNVAAKRIQKVLDDLENLSKCANKASYEYSEEDIRKMKKAVNEKVNHVWNSFASNTHTSKKNFQF